MPLVIVHEVRDSWPTIIADVRNFGFRVGSECALPARGYALPTLRATSSAGCKSGSAGCCQQGSQLSGTWYREIEGAVFSATFSGDELKVCMTQCEDGFAMCFTVTADYAMTKDGTVHGVVTGVDVQASRESDRMELAALPTAAMTADLQKLVDSPFSFRTRVTSAGVMVSNLKIAMESTEKPDLAMACGMFKHAADGQAPAPKPQRTSARPVAPRAVPVCRTGPDLQPPVANVIPAAYPPPPAYSPPRPVNVPAGEFGTMADVFGQMLGTKPQTLPVTTPPIVRTELSTPIPTLPVPTPPRIEKPR